MPSDTKDRLIAAAWECIRDGGQVGATSWAITSAAGREPRGHHVLLRVEGCARRRGGRRRDRSAGRPRARPRCGNESLDPASRLVNAIAELQRAYDISTDDAPAYLEVLVQRQRQPELHAPRRSHLCGDPLDALESDGRPQGEGRCSGLGRSGRDGRSTPRGRSGCRVARLDRRRGTVATVDDGSVRTPAACESRRAQLTTRGYDERSSLPGRVASASSTGVPPSRMTVPLTTT